MMQTVEAYPWQIQHDHNTPPGRGGSMCKRIRRTAKLYSVAWRFKRHRWSKGWRLYMRKHGWRDAGVRLDLTDGGYRRERVEQEKKP